MMSQPNVFAEPPGDFDLSETFSDVEFNWDKILVPPPMVKKEEPLEASGPDVIGKTTVSKQNALIEKYVELEGFAGDIISIYNNWITNTLKKQLDGQTIEIENKPDHKRYAKFINMHIDPPMIKNDILTPAQARHRKITYEATVTVWVGIYSVYKNDQPQLEKVSKPFVLVKIPVMLGSCICHLHGKTKQQRKAMAECEFDPLGYFLIRGMEKVVLTQERLRYNRMFQYVSKIDNKVIPKIEMKIRTLYRTHVITIYAESREKAPNKGSLKVHLTIGVEENISVFQIYRIFALLFPEDTAERNNLLRPDFMLQMILLFVKPEWQSKVTLQLQPSFIHLLGINDDIRDIASKKNMNIVQNDDKKALESGKGITYDQAKKEILTLFYNMFMPHMKNEPIVNRLYLLSLMLARFGEYLAGLRKMDDRDSWANKRLETAGSSLEQLFGDYLQQSVRKIQSQIRSKHVPIDLNALETQLRTTHMSDNIIKSFNAGNWGTMSYYMKKKENMTDSLKRDSLLTVYSQILRVNTPTDRRAKQINIRMIQLSQLGYICPSETPEGEQCFFSGTRILCPEGVIRTIGELKDGDEVVTVNMNDYTTRISKIKNHFIKNSAECGKKMFKVRTLNEREVICTEDHPFLVIRRTDDSNFATGWVRVDQIQKDDWLIVHPMQEQLSSSVPQRKIVVEAYDLEVNLRKLGMKVSLIDKYVEELVDIGILPLYNDDPKLQLISRICGFMLGDGCMSFKPEKKDSPSGKMCFGTNYDATLYQQDLNRLGWKKDYKITYTESDQTDPFTGRRFSNHTYNCSIPSNMCALLMALGMMYGKRTKKPSNPVPDWIMNGSMAVKREFVSGFHGADGCKINSVPRLDKVTAQKYSFGCPAQHKYDPHVPSLEFFMEQMKQLITELGVDVLKVESRVDKNVSSCYQVSYYMSNSEVNLVKYMDKIGFRYASTKESESILITEYLRYKQTKIVDIDNLKAKIFDMYDNKNMKPLQISKILNMEKSKVENVLEYRKNRIKLGKWDSVTNTTTTINTCKSLPDMKTTITFEKWESLTKSVNGSVIMPILSITPEPPCMIADFTTENDDHSFIANSIVTHNCGLVKQKTVACYITTDSDDKYIQLHILKQLVRPHPDQESASPLLLNGKFLGWCKGELTLQYLIHLRRSGRIAKGVSTVLDKDMTLNVYTDGDRPTRPLLIVDQETGELVYDLKKDILYEAGMDRLISEGAVEYIDAWDQSELDQNYILIAQTQADLKAYTSQIAETRRKIDSLKLIIARMTGLNILENTELLTEEQRRIVFAYIPVQQVVGEEQRVVYIGAPEPGYNPKYVIEDRKLVSEFTKVRMQKEQELKTAQDVLEELEKKGKTKYTHCEIDPNAVLGVAASIIPLMNHNVGPRVTYQCTSLDTSIKVSRDGSQIIQNLRDGDTVLTVNPRTHEISETQIKNHFIIDAEEHGKTVYTLETETGKTISATGDHPFLTKSGFIRADKLNVEEDEVAICEV